MYLIIILLTFIASAAFCHYFAKIRGANPVFWGLMGGIFGPLAIPFVFFSRTGK